MTIQNQNKVKLQLLKNKKRSNFSRKRKPHLPVQHQSIHLAQPHHLVSDPPLLSPLLSIPLPIPSPALGFSPPPADSRSSTTTSPPPTKTNTIQSQHRNTHVIQSNRIEKVGEKTAPLIVFRWGETTRRERREGASMTTSRAVFRPSFL